MNKLYTPQIHKNLLSPINTNTAIESCNRGGRKIDFCKTFVSPPLKKSRESLEKSHNIAFSQTNEQQNPQSIIENYILNSSTSENQDDDAFPTFIRQSFSDIIATPIVSDKSNENEKVSCDLSIFLKKEINSAQCCESQIITILPNKIKTNTSSSQTITTNFLSKCQASCQTEEQAVEECSSLYPCELRSYTYALHQFIPDNMTESQQIIYQPVKEIVIDNDTKIELELLKNQFTSINNDLANTYAEVEKKNQENIELLKLLSEMEQSIESAVLQKQKEMEEQNIKSLIVLKGSYTKQIDSLQQSLKGSETTCHLYKTQLDEIYKKLEKFEKENEEMKKIIEEKDKVNKELDNKYNLKEKQFNELRKLHHKVNDDFEKRMMKAKKMWEDEKTRAIKYHEEINKKNNEIIQQTNKAESIEKELKLLKEKSNLTNVNQNKLNSDYQKMKNDYEKLNKDFEELKNEHTNFLQRSAIEKGDLAAQITLLKEKNESELILLKNENTDLKVKLFDITSQITKLKEQDNNIICNSEILDENQKLKDQVAELEQTNSELMSYMEQLLNEQAENNN